MRENRRLTFETINAAVDVRLAQQHARVVDQVAGREVVGAIDDYVVARKQVESVFARQPHWVRDDVDIRVEGGKPLAGGVDLRPPDVLCRVEYLTLQVRQVDRVEVNESDAAHAGSCEIQPRRRSQGRRRPPGAPAPAPGVRWPSGPISGRARWRLYLAGSKAAGFDCTGSFFMVFSLTS